MICAAKASLLRDLTLELQTLASKVKNDNFNLSEFLVQAAELSDCSQKLASDLCTEAQKALKEYQQTIYFECTSNKEDDLVDHDPGKRPQKLSENQRKYLISLDPCQPQLSTFSKKKELGKCSKQCKFSAAWYSKFPNLEYSVSRDAAYCFVCSLFPEGPGRANADPAWVQGNNTLSKMKGSLGRNKEGKLVSHFTSESHKTAMMDFIRFTSASSHVDVQLNKKKRAFLLAEEKLRQQNTEVITILLDVARTLARQGIAFRGDGDDKDGNFPANYSSCK